MTVTFKSIRLITALLILLSSGVAHAQFFSKSSNELLPEDEAFSVLATVNGSTLKVNWVIAPDYYMYREQFSISSNTAGITLGDINFPKGEIENDPEFGEVEVYFYNAELSTPISGSSSETTFDITIKGQGCNKPVGVCYPPQTRILTLNAASLKPSSQETTAGTANDGSSNTTARASTTRTPTNSPITKSPEAQDASSSKSFLSYVLTALGAGILLSFTPCVLPMIPILAGVIAGQKKPSKLFSGWLSICYVLGTIVTYAFAGWIAGASGTQLQAYFQDPWVLGLISLILLALATSLFGAFKIQLPSSLQTKLSGAGVNSKSAPLSAFGLGLISALVVGACVSPVLILSLGAAITQGDPVLGAAIMASMALGMGLLLVLFGFGAGWILPRTGAWMNQIQVLFGFMVVGVAIYLSSSINGMPSLYLWAGLLIWSGLYLWQVGAQIATPMVNSAIKAIASITLIWGAMSLVGASNGGQDVLNPLERLSFSTSQQVSTKLTFTSVTTVSEAKALLANAKSTGRPALVDFYADWCLDCKRMHKTTFRDPNVVSALADWELIEINVTDTNEDAQKVKKYFSVFGPPATLYYGSDGTEFKSLRQYGYMKSDDFLRILAQAN